MKRFLYQVSKLGKYLHYRFDNGKGLLLFRINQRSELYALSKDANQFNDLANYGQSAQRLSWDSTD